MKWVQISPYPTEVRSIQSKQSATSVNIRTKFDKFGSTVSLYIVKLDVQFRKFRIRSFAGDCSFVSFEQEMLRASDTRFGKFRQVVSVSFCMFPISCYTLTLFRHLHASTRKASSAITYRLALVVAVKVVEQLVRTPQRRALEACQPLVQLVARPICETRC